MKKSETKLIIVESPTKIRSLSRFLGKEYTITSSKGHLIDLPKSRMGIDIENNFAPSYMTIRGKGKILAELKKAANGVLEVMLATDPDREGEAISWHLARVLGDKNQNIKRIEFNEITKEAVLKAIENPRDIDIEKVNSQQARRLLDRLVGYSISPVLQEKFGSKRFSAGRVQSAALRIICDRESEIEKFKPQEYWEFEAFWNNSSTKKMNEEAPFKLVHIDGKKAEISNTASAQEIEDGIKNSVFIVKNKKESERKSKPTAPYTTSRLQQEGSTKLGFRAQKTMSVAQSLYEGVTLDEGETTGLVTYIRTDSTRVADTALASCREYIRKEFSGKYLPEKANIYHTAKQAQDAHEAIRPTVVDRKPESIRGYLSPEQYKLYKMIWQKFVASQMLPAIDVQTTFEVVNPKADKTKGEHEFLFRFTTSEEIFNGFRAVLPQKKQEKYKMPNFKKDEDLRLIKLNKEQKFTQPPPRYSEASLIRVMEESGIGRPATYAPTIGTLDKRAYIERKGRQLNPTMLGKVVNELLVAHFPDIVDLAFTANMEEKLDNVAEGNTDWQQMLGNFFHPFKKVVDKASQTMESKVHLVRIPVDRQCPLCEEGQLYKKLGKNGFFIGCDRFKDGCRFNESISLGICPLCKGSVVKKKSKKGRNFYGCANYSSSGCEFIMTEKPASKKCQKCDSIMGERVRKDSITLTCQNQDCKFSVQELGDD